MNASEFALFMVAVAALIAIALMVFSTIVCMGVFQ